MTRQDYELMDKPDLAYHLLLCKLAFFKSELCKITLCRRKTSRGRYIADIVCLVKDRRGMQHMDYFRMHDEEYLWFFGNIQNDFPDVEFEDLTEERYKLKDDRVQNDEV